MTAPLSPRARVGDADRERIVAKLQRYVSEGYLTLEEFSNRSAMAYRATTRAELTALTEDLPRNTGMERTPSAGGRMNDRRSWSPVVIAVAVVVGVVLLAAVVVTVIMLAMMGNMGGMGVMR